MEDDPLVRMYEAAEKKQLEINKLEAEKEELERKIRQLELEKSTVADKSDDGWTVLDKLQREARESGDNLEENRFKEETHGNFQTAQSLQENMRKDLTEQIKRNTDQAGSLQLQITKVSSKVDQIQETVTNQGKLLDFIARTLGSSSQHIKLDTILLMGGGNEYYRPGRFMTVLTDRADWKELKETTPPYDVFGSGAVFLHNELYVVGGEHNMKALYKLDKNLEWKRLTDMNVGRRNIANSCVEANGYIWVFGGSDEVLNGLKSVERYDPKEDKWTLMPEMSTARADAAAVFWQDRIIVCGGWIEEKRVTSSAECFLLETGEWTSIHTLPDNIYDHSLVSYENKLILMGGATPKGSLKSVWEMDPLQPNDGWKSLPPMKYARQFFRGLVLDQEIYAVGGGGSDKTVLDRVEIFDGKSWRDGPSLHYGRWAHSAIVIPQSLADRLCQYKP